MTSAADSSEPLGPSEAAQPPGSPGAPYGPPLGRQTVPWVAPEQLTRWGLPADETTPGDYIIELNLQHRGAVEGAEQRFLDLLQQVLPGVVPTKLSQTYFSCKISRQQQQELVRLDRQAEPKDRAIFRIWPDFEVHALIDASVATVKADAARRSYVATGAGITWAVLDSGIDGTHPHFQAAHTLDHESVADLHRDFTVDGEPARDSALIDEFGHGTHVAGIIAGGLDGLDPAQAPLVVFEKVLETDASGRTAPPIYDVRDATRGLVVGVAPACRLVSLKVLDRAGNGRTSNLIRALQHIREKINADPKVLRVHGVNISAGYEFNAEVFACGQSPLCVEVDRLVRAGVVVVVAAGNTGYGALAATDRPGTRTGLVDTINDPGNARLAITVGATHRNMPHTYGVSYFSSKGPTADGRLKPDLLAPGERITSCATGAWLQAIRDRLPQQPPPTPSIPDSAAVYVDYSGTSMAAPHVSGAIAAFLSIRQEFIQQPDEVKRIFLSSATSLGRDRYYEGHGLVDLMRAIQSV